MSDNTKYGLQEFIKLFVREYISSHADERIEIREISQAVESRVTTMRWSIEWSGATENAFRGMIEETIREAFRMAEESYHTGYFTLVEVRRHYNPTRDQIDYQHQVVAMRQTRSDAFLDAWRITVPRDRFPAGEENRGLPYIPTIHVFQVMPDGSDVPLAIYHNGQPFYSRGLTR